MKGDAAWEALKTTLANRVERMTYAPMGDRRGAYEDVLLLMEDIEERES